MSNLATLSEAAVHFGVSAALMTRKKKQGKLVMQGDLVNLAESAEAFGGHGKKVGHPKQQSVDENFGAAQLRKESALATLRELELAQKQGEVIPIDTAASAWATVGQTIRDGLLSLPERVAPELAALTDARQIRDILRDEMRKLLLNLPEQIHQKIAA